MKRFIPGAFLAALSCLLPVSGHAADFPTAKPVTIVVPFSAGGPTDKVVRELAQSMSRSLGQSVMVENVVGAGGTIGSRKVVAAPKDGYMVLVHTMGMATAPALYRGLNFDAITDFDHIGQIVDVPMVILGSRKLPHENFPALLQHIKANPGQVSIGHAGPGSAAHLCTLLFASALKAELVSVAYKGSAPALSDVIGGQIDLVCDQTTSTAGQIQAGTVRPYAITTLNRASPFDDMPTANEQGLKGFDVKTWHGMYAPKGLPPAVRDRLVAALKASVQDPVFKQKMTELGGQVVSPADASPESLKAKLTAETALWGKVIKAAGIQPN